MHLLVYKHGGPWGNLDLSSLYTTSLEEDKELARIANNDSNSSRYCRRQGNTADGETSLCGRTCTVAHSYTISEGIGIIIYFYSAGTAGQR